MSQSVKMDKIIRAALKEDIAGGDITTRALIPKNQISQAIIMTREPAVIFGLKIVKKLFRHLDKTIQIRFFCKDGSHVLADKNIVTLKGKTRAILTGERVALNFLSHLSGIATTTAAYLKKIHPYRAQLMDTRKTTPGLRFLEKAAVRCAGATNHRDNLNEMILIKDNHKAAYGAKIALQKMVSHAKKVSKKPVQIEVDTLHDFSQALVSHANLILLDNMTLPQIKRAVKLRNRLRNKQKPALEVSGRVNLKNIRSIAKTGIERISVGAITHSRKAIDFTLEFIK